MGADIYDNGGWWKFKFEWEMDNDVMAELKWEQQFSPDQPDNTLSVTAADDIKILSFKEIVCNEQSDAGSKKLDLSYTNPWRKSNGSRGLKAST